MNTYKFIVIEGLDGSGKSTQVNKLIEYYKNNNIKYKYLHFPRTDAPYFGELIARFLRGEFGSLDKVDPYIVALLYAGDRHHASEEMKSWLNEGYSIILDRYVYSNIAYQCAKILNANEQNKLKNWILSLEYNYFKLPKPDITIFLDVPFSFTFHKLSNRREGIERDYLKGKSDIHEENLEFQKRVRNIYKSIDNEDNNFHVLKCYDEHHKILNPDEIFKMIKTTLRLYDDN
ncbi:MAG: thymidylate kinase [Marinilabiliales bacterium]